MKSSSAVSNTAAPVQASRRRFLGGAAAGTAAAATLGFPAIVKGQTPTNFRFQSTWPTVDIFHEFALDLAQKINDMTGGELKIEVLPAGAVVPAFSLLDAVAKGTLDGGHGVLGYNYGKQNALALFSSGPAFGMDANMLLAWHKYGGGQELLEKLYKSIDINVVSILYGPMPTQPFGWFKKPVTRVEDLKGLKFRTNGLAIDLFTSMGAAVNALPGGEIVPALDRGLLDGAEFNNATRSPAGFPGCLEGLHAAELPPIVRNLRSDLQPTKVQRTARHHEGHHSQRLRSCIGRYVMESHPPLFRRLHQAAEGRRCEVLQDTGRHPATAASDVG